VARLWEDLRRGTLGTDYVAARIAELDNPGGDIDTLQGRIAAIRSWAYITQRPDWVLAREEMAARAQAVEARLSDALHARLTERFVNRRTAVLMRQTGQDAALLPVALEGDDILVDGEKLGTLEGFRFRIDPDAHSSDHKLLFAAAERHLPQLLAQRAEALAPAVANNEADLALGADGGIMHGGERLASLGAGRNQFSASLRLEPALEGIPAPQRDALREALEGWLARKLAVLEPLAKLDEASRAAHSGPELRALLILIVERGGALERASSGLDGLQPEQRDALRKLGVRIGALDLFMPAMLKAGPLAMWHHLGTARGRTLPAVLPEMPPVIALEGGQAPLGYRRVGRQAIRLDMAEKLLREAHERRPASIKATFRIDPAMARSMGLALEHHIQLLRAAGFVISNPRALAAGAFGPPAPASWRWRPAPRQPAPAAVAKAAPPPPGNPFAALAELVR
jgi:ATP-dependent RNA helicase SUPV3L1/SUV3